MNVARRTELLRGIARFLATIVVVEGCLVLAGWAFDIVVLKSVLPGLTTMKPNTAVAFLLLGFAVRREALQSLGASAPRYVSVIAAFATLVGLLTVAEHILGIDAGIDTVLFHGGVVAENAANPGRMAPLTAACVLLLGVAVWTVGRRRRWSRVAEGLAVTVAVVSLVALTGYLYGVRSLYSVTGFSSMAVHTATALLLLSLAQLACHPERGLAAIVVSDGPGGRAARRLLPAALVLPLILGWLRIAGERAGLYNTAFGVSLLVLALISIFSAVILWNARSLDRLEAERRQAEEETREKSRFLQLILDRMSDGVIVSDAHGNFLLFNRAAEELLGMGSAPVGAAGWADHYGIFREDGQTPFPSLELPLARAIRGEEALGVELVSRHPGRPDGMWLRVSARPLQDPRGGLQGGLAMFADITESRRLEEARRRGVEIEESRRRIEETSRLKSEFLANMSHELRTPLNAIIGFTELLHDGKVGPLDSQQLEFVGDILSSSRHLLQLINDVLDLSKIEAGKIELHPERFAPVEVAAEIRDSLRAMAASKRIAVSVETAGLREVLADRGKLRQILYNYVSNALKFTPEGGRVTMRIAREGERAFRVEVEDTGIGIRAADMERLFVQFQQLDATSTKKFPGTGLGLALTKRIVEAQGGRVGASSRPGAGSVFFAILPTAIATGPAVLAGDAEDDEEALWLASRS